jgi:hypothetical protein
MRLRRTKEVDLAVEVVFLVVVPFPFNSHHHESTFLRE